MENIYIMIFGIANMVAGGPIYNSNKIKYLEERGWRVIVFPTNCGEVYIKPLEKYNGSFYDFIVYPPFIFSNLRISKFLDSMVEKIPKSDNIIVETGTDYTALWGELLAERLGAKHIVMFLDEKNERIDKYSAPFYEFKFKRKELTSISEQSMMRIFSPFFLITNPEKYVWTAWCSNSVADIESPILNDLPDADFMIGSIGRLEKSFVMNIVDGVCEFANIVKERQVGLCFFGGSDKETILNIEKRLSKHDNISLYISGYIWPIPEKVFKRFDIFLSGAGAALVSANMGVTTVRMDVITNNPIGFIDDPLINHMVKNVGKKHEVVDYLLQGLIDKRVPEIINRQSVEENWKTICKDFDNQMKFIESSEVENKVYYPTKKIWDHKAIHLAEKIVAHMTTYRQFKKIQKKYYRLRRGGDE